MLLRSAEGINPSDRPDLPLPSVRIVMSVVHHPLSMIVATPPGIRTDLFDLHLRDAVGFGVYYHGVGEVE